jgi:hypothetical protein
LIRNSRSIPVFSCAHAQRIWAHSVKQVHCY